MWAGLRALATLTSAVHDEANHPAGEAAAVATTLLPALRAVDNDEEDAYDDLYRVLEDLLPPRAGDSAERVRRVLVFLGHAAHSR